MSKDFQGILQTSDFLFLSSTFHTVIGFYSLCDLVPRGMRIKSFINVIIGVAREVKMMCGVTSVL